MDTSLGLVKPNKKLINNSQRTCIHNHIQDIILMNIIQALPEDLFGVIYTTIRDVSSLYMLSKTSCEIRTAVIRYSKIHYVPNLTHYVIIAEGHLEILKFYHEVWKPNKVISSDLCCTTAATYGQLHILKWLRSQNWAWSYRTCEEAAANGHLEILQWAAENECGWSLDVGSIAVRFGHLDVFKWIHQEKLSFHIVPCMMEAARSGSLEIVKYFHKHFWFHDAIYEEIINAGHKEVFVWLAGCVDNNSFSDRVRRIAKQKWPDLVV